MHACMHVPHSLESESTSETDTGASVMSDEMSMGKG